MDSPTCSQKNCNRPVDRRPNGEFFRSCAKCRTRRAAWQRRKEAHRIANGQCRSCGRPRSPDDVSSSDRCAPCRKRRTQRATSRTKARITKPGICRCGRPCDTRPDGTLYYRCPTCRAARRNQKADLLAQGGCIKCYHRQRAAGDTLCPVCRERYPAHLARRRELEAARPPRRRTGRTRRRNPTHRTAILGPPALNCPRNSNAATDAPIAATRNPTARSTRNAVRAASEGNAAALNWSPRAVASNAATASATRAIATAPAAGSRRTRKNAEARELRRLAREIDQWAAKPERNFEPTPEDCGISRWNSRKPREASAAYWSPLPDPKPAEPDAYRYRRKFRRY